MLGALALLILQVQPPNTINGDTLGPAEQFATTGPATVCMRNLSVTAREGESIHLAYAGIHSGTLRLVAGRRYVDVMHGEAFVSPKQPLASVENRAGWRVYRWRQDGKPAYLFLDGTEGEGRSDAQVRITGPALTGTARDRALLAQVNVGKDDATGCDRTYTYGWAMLLGDEPVSRKGDR